MNQIVEVELTAPSRDWLVDFTRRLVERRLVACGSIEMGEVRSLYWWDGEVQDAHEGRVRFHTRESLVPRVEAVVDTQHPYEVPGFRWWPITASKAYHQWVLNETAAAD